MNLPPAGAVSDEREVEAVLEVLRSNPKLNLGETTVRFEAAVAPLLSKKHGLMVNSGSSALRIAIDLLGLEAGDEIITSPLTFSTDIAPMVQSGIVPVFVDITPDTYQLDAAAVEAMISPRTKAILTPNLCGNCPDWDALRAVADAHGLKVVEDSCDVLDSWQRGTRTGERSDISVTSFATSHAMTAGGTGGMVGIDDDDLFDKALSLRRWGRQSDVFTFGSKQGEDARFGKLADGTDYDMIFLFDQIGYNFEPNEMSAAYGLVQLEKLPDFNAQRQANWGRLDQFVATRDGMTAGVTTPETETTWMRFCATVDEDAPFDRLQLQEFLADKGISTRMVWTGNVLRQPGFQGIAHRAPEAGLPNCDRVMDRAVSLPVYHGLNADHMGYMCEQLDALYDHYS